MGACCWVSLGKQSWQGKLKFIICCLFAWGRVNWWFWKWHDLVDCWRLGGFRWYSNHYYIPEWVVISLWRTGNRPFREKSTPPPHNHGPDLRPIMKMITGDKLRFMLRGPLDCRPPHPNTITHHHPPPSYNPKEWMGKSLSVCGVSEPLHKHLHFSQVIGGFFQWFLCLRRTKSPSKGMLVVGSLLV